jgi:hypothetical protein
MNAATREWLEPFDTFIATFQPRRTDDLKPGVAEWIGWSGVWQAMWMIQEGESTKFVGQWACAPQYDRNTVSLPFAWVPDEDLVIQEFVDPPVGPDAGGETG